MALHDRLHLNSLPVVVLPLPKIKQFYHISVAGK